MFSVNQLSISFSGIPLFTDVSFFIDKKARIGLTGRNGAGKSTLLKIIQKSTEPDSGQVDIPADATIGYLPQHMPFSDNNSVYNETKTAFSNVIELKREIAELANELGDRTDYSSEEYNRLVNRYTLKEEHYSLLGVNNIEAQTEQTLKGLGFERSDFQRPTSEFSGGWRMRIELAKILLQKPDLLLLDEPTNHLDIESIQWLEDFLKDYHGAIILISHDRTFLDSLTNRTLEIVKGKLYDYKASYTKFQELRAMRIEQQIAAYNNQQKFIQETERFIERFRYKASKAVQVQSRVKQLEKLERIEIDETDLKDISFRFPEAPLGGELSVDMENLTKKYGENTILKDIYLTIERGEKVAFVGKNGEGKSTLVKVIMQETDYEGNLKLGHNIDIGYFAQDFNEKLDFSKTVFDTLDDIAVGDIRTKLRSILGQFLFSGEDADKKVEVLSGGERTRLALANLMLKPHNFMILDEPTNHLDIRAKDMLKKALSQYKGTLVIVSHDRDFLQGLCGKIYEFGKKKIKQHSGDINMFLEKKMQEYKTEQLIKVNAKTNQNDTKSENKISYELRKEADKKIRKLKNEIGETEERIQELERYIEESEGLLAAGEFIDDKDFYIKLNQQKAELETKMTLWEQLQEQLEILEEERGEI